MALGLLAGAAKLLGGKEKKSGAKMASAIVKREPQQDAIAKKQPSIKSKTKVVSVSRLMDTKSFESQSRKQSKKSSGVDSIDGALDSIDNTLDGLIATIKSSSQFQKDEIKRKNRSRIRRGKREREGELEGGVPKFGMRVPGPFKSAFNTIKNFFSNIIIGSLVLLVVNNIESIMNSLKKVYDTMKNVVTKVGEFLQPLWTALKWIWPGNSPSGLEMVRAILANKNTQDLMDERKINEIKEESDKVVEETKRLEGLFQNIEKDANIEPEDEMEPSTMNDVPPPPPPPADVRSAESPSIWDSVGQFFSGIGNAITGGDKKSTNSSVSGSGSSTGGEIGKLLDTIAFAEGTANQPNNGYNTHFGFSQTADLSKHPNKVITSGGRSSAAFGRYQFMPGTWASVGGGAMTPARQDWGATRLILMRLGLPQTKAGAAKLEKMLKENGLTPQIIDALAPEWASFPNLFGPDQKGRVGTNTSFYGQGGKTKQQLESYFKGRPSSSTSALPTLNQSIDDQSGNSSFVPVVLPSSNVASAAGKVVVAPLGGVNNNYQRILHMQFYRA